jgi:hypothetical protein
VILFDEEYLFKFRVESMASRIIAVSFFSICAIATLAWTTFLGWGLYELLHWLS